MAAAAVFALERRDLSRCEDARRTVFAVTLGRAPASAQPAALRAIRDACRGTTATLAAVGALERQGRRAQALPLAREAVEAEPDNPAGWRALAAVASGAELRAAERRLGVLDPLRSLNRSSGRSTR